MNSGDSTGGGQADRAADAERAFERPGEAAHDRRQDAPVKQQRGQHAHHQHDRQRLKAEHEFIGRAGHGIWRGAAADITEHETGAGDGRRAHCLDRAVDQRETGLDLRDFQKQYGGGEGQGQGRARALPVDRAPVLADQEGKGDEAKRAERRLQVVHRLIPHMAVAKL
jgi:hypothetical protein